MALSEQARTRQAGPQAPTRSPMPARPQRQPLLLHLQRVAGNRAVLRLRDHGLLQARLTVGPADDPYEREADRVASQVVNRLATSPRGVSPAPATPGALQREPEEEEWIAPRRSDMPSLQRQEDEEWILPRRAGATVVQRQEEEELVMPRRSGVPVVQRQEDDELLLLRRTGLPEVQRQSEQEEEEEEEELLMPRRSAMPAVQRQEGEEELALASPAGPGMEGGAVSGAVESRIDAGRGGGQPLGAPLRSAFEQAFGHGFSGVRIHADAPADQAARALNADAFTTERDIYFRAGLYEPETESGQFLLAHELTHVVQQDAAEQSPDAD